MLASDLGGRLRLALEARDRFLILQRCWEQKFDCDVFVETQMASGHHDPHRSLSQDLFYPVLAGEHDAGSDVGEKWDGHALIFAARGPTKVNKRTEIVVVLSSS